MRQREPTLAAFALLMLLLAVPTMRALVVDTRLVHGVNVWVKPLKFMLALAVFAATTRGVVAAACLTPPHAIPG